MKVHISGVGLIMSLVVPVVSKRRKPTGQRTTGVCKYIGMSLYMKGTIIAPELVVMGGEKVTLSKSKREDTRLIEDSMNKR